MGDFIKTLTSLIGSIKAKTDGKIDILQKRIDDIPTETVLYTPQTLTEEQQKQARDNIGATDAGSMFVVITKSVQNGETIYSADKTYDEIMEAVKNKIVPVCNNPVDESVYGPNNVRCIFRNSFYVTGVEYASFQSDGDEYFYEVLIFNGGKVTATSKPKIMTGATTDNNGTSGMVPLPYRGDNTKFRRGDGRGADVEGDTSLGITGAQIAQIAKITAVDTDGKPTAWEPVDMAGGGGEKWEKIAEIELRTDTAEYVLADFATWRKAKVIMTRSQYISGLNKNVWCRVVGLNSDDTYTCGFLTIGYGYIFWEYSAEVNELFILSSHIETNNRKSAESVRSTGTFMPLASPVETYKFKLMFVDTSVIQSGDKVTVIGVRR